MKRIFLSIAAAALLSFGAEAQNLVEGSIQGAPQHEAYTPSFKYDGSSRQVRNVILMIGDGTGLAQISAGLFSNGGELTVTNLKHYGLVKTASADAYTTDSAASGTAYATGHKTYNYAVGVDVDRQPLENLPELLSRYGIISGVVSTDDLNGATPASFFAHQPGRGMTAEIWADLPQSSLTFFAAGSKEKFAEQSQETRDAINRVFTVVDALPDDTRGIERMGYLPPKTETQSFSKGRGDFLPATTKYCIDFLSERTNRRKGFFMMVEGARIDKSCHGNDYPTAVLEMLDFDQAIEQAVRFAEKDGHTLVLVSADHETGGLSLAAQGDPEKGDTAGRFSTGGHTPIPVPIFAYGPGSQYFIGIQENSDVANKIITLLTGK